MRITRDELIEELKKLPSNVEIEFSADVKTRCHECSTQVWHGNDAMMFDGISFGYPATIKLTE